MRRLAFLAGVGSNSASSITGTVLHDPLFSRRRPPPAPPSSVRGRPMSGPVVIVGAGTAGMRAGEALRKAGYDGAVALLGEEPYPPYQRPPLSKKFLMGRMAQEQLWLQGEGFFEQNAIDFQPGARVEAIDPGA